MMQPIKVTFIEPVENWKEIHDAYVVDEHTFVTFDESDDTISFRWSPELRILSGQQSLVIRIGKDEYRVITFKAPKAGVEVKRLDEVTLTDFIKKYFEKGRL